LQRDRSSFAWWSVTRAFVACGQAAMLPTSPCPH
jgi:hypothetical protein